MKHQPGDGCRLLGGGLVEHVDCHDYPAGTVTNCVTGEVVSRPR
jgi:hypothetical protein